MASTSKMAMETMDTSTANKKEVLHKEEEEQYDRQIRLWGIESQLALRLTSILFVGMNGLVAETVKNIMLTGVKSITLLDDKLVNEEDFCSQYFLPRDSLGQSRVKSSLKRARKLNPTVKLIPDTDSLSSKDDEYFSQFDIVVLSGVETSEILRINKICRAKGIKFFASDVWGLFGWIFVDLQKHDYIAEISKYKVISEASEKMKTELVTRRERRTVDFPPYDVVHFNMAIEVNCKRLKRNGPSMVLLQIMQEFRDKHKYDPRCEYREEDIKELKRIRDAMKNSDMVKDETLEYVFAQIAAGTAVLGGILAQEVMKSITRSGKPIYNMFLFDPDSHSGFIETIGNL